MLERRIDIRFNFKLEKNNVQGSALITCDSSIQLAKRRLCNPCSRLGYLKDNNTTERHCFTRHFVNTETNLTKIIQTTQSLGDLK